MRPLNDNIFVDYFGDNADGFFNFETYKTGVKLEGRDITLIVFGADRSFVFRANTDIEARSWYQEIKKHIRHSVVKHTEVPQKDFWKFSELSEDQLLKEAQTCDLLLFRGSRGGSSLIRSYTRGHFDHVALIVRTDEDGSNDFSIIEAVGKLGVTATTWSNVR